jgi:hypothetical protein
MLSGVVISAAVEGIVDEAVIHRLVTQAGAIPGIIYGKNGKQDIRLKIQGYNGAAQRTPWIVLVDLDNDADCATILHATWLPDPAPFMCFRVAVRQVEAWLLADREQVASLFPNRACADPNLWPTRQWSAARTLTRSTMTQFANRPRPVSPALHCALQTPGEDGTEESFLKGHPELMPTLSSRDPNRWCDRIDGRLPPPLQSSEHRPRRSVSI